MISNLKTPKLELDAQFMAWVGQQEIDLIQKDTEQGITQSKTGLPTSPYRSESYKSAKANYMKRKTNRTGPKGSNLKAVQSGTGVRSNETSIKNYKLTGVLLKGLHIENPRTNEVTVGYNPGDTGKLLGAMNSRDELVGLNDDNIDTIEQAIFKELSKNVDIWAREDIVITVTK